MPNDAEDLRNDPCMRYDSHSPARMSGRSGRKAGKYSRAELSASFAAWPRERVIALG
jgi:hypothetical protein